MNRDIVFVYDHYYPDYSAGGPVTSLHNLSGLIKDFTPVKILTSAYGYDSGDKLEGVLCNQWSGSDQVKCWYAEDTQSIEEAVSSLADGTVIYLNGIFSRNYFLRVLKLSRNRKFDIIISPRGMLQEGALKNKLLKKSIYLLTLKMLGLLANVRWHATDDREKLDIIKNFGSGCRIDVIPNVPRLPAAENKPLPKSPGSLRLIYFSLISRKKNLGFIIDLLKSKQLSGITMNIVGPLKDGDYWREVEGDITTSNGMIRYLGDVDPEAVNDLLSGYHLLVLPTHGENFGHAIVEAMGSWRPVMISENTPWKDVEPFHGGFAIPLVASQWEQKLKEAREWRQSDFDNACVGAMDYFRNKIDVTGLLSQYLSLFRIQS